MVFLMATIRWCPIFPKWDSYQPLIKTHHLTFREITWLTSESPSKGAWWPVALSATSEEPGQRASGGQVDLWFPKGNEENDENNHGENDFGRFSISIYWLCLIFAYSITEDLEEAVSQYFLGQILLNPSCLSVKSLLLLGDIGLGPNWVPH